MGGENLICNWEAPAWVYEHVEPVPDVDTIDEFRIKAVREMSKNGWPGLDVSEYTVYGL